MNIIGNCFSKKLLRTNITNDFSKNTNAVSSRVNAKKRQKGGGFSL